MSAAGVAVKFLKPLISLEEAHRLLRPGSLIPRVLWSPDSKGADEEPRIADRGEPPFLELLAMPFHYFTIEAIGPHETTATGIMVEGFSGTLSTFDLDKEKFAEEPLENIFEPSLCVDEAEQIARRRFLNNVRAASKARNRLTMGPTRSHELVHYPYWVYYYERRPGRLDLRLLDALNGKKPGAKMKLSVIDALRQAADGKSSD